jgi:hypothetical protein
VKNNREKKTPKAHDSQTIENNFPLISGQVEVSEGGGPIEIFLYYKFNGNCCG